MSRDFWVSSGGRAFWNLGQKTPATEWERQIDELMARQAATLDDQERRRLFNEVQRLFAENLPMLYFAAPRVYIGASSRLMNLHPALTRPPLMWSVDTMALKPPSRLAELAMSLGRYVLGACGAALLLVVVVASVALLLTIAAPGISVRRRAGPRGSRRASAPKWASINPILTQYLDMAAPRGRGWTSGNRFSTSGRSPI